MQLRKIVAATCVVTITAVAALSLRKHSSEKMEEKITPISIYDACLSDISWEEMSKLPLNDYFLNGNAYTEFISAKWNTAEEAYDEKQFEKAIYAYKDVLVAFAYNNSDPYFNVTYDTVAKNYETRFFSLYNISCCYSLEGKLEDSEAYLIKAIESGYPYFKHILQDTDLDNLFNAKPELKKTVKELFDRGNDKNAVIGKELHFIYGPNSGLTIRFVDDNTFVYNPWSEGNKKADHYYFGTYELKHYNAVINFYRETYKDMSKSKAYYLDLREGNYTTVDTEINDTMILPLSMEENNLIKFCTL
ncbi:MAG: hypothetical protein IJ828_01600 [Treponema sp.]|nr:hypothetical protein [Treponema sp.]